MLYTYIHYSYQKLSKLVPTAAAYYAMCIVCFLVHVYTINIVYTICLSYLLLHIYIYCNYILIDQSMDNFVKIIKLYVY